MRSLQLLDHTLSWRTAWLPMCRAQSSGPGLEPQRAQKKIREIFDLTGLLRPSKVDRELFQRLIPTGETAQNRPVENQLERHVLDQFAGYDKALVSLHHMPSTQVHLLP